MTAPTLPRLKRRVSRHRPSALRYLRDSRVVVWRAIPDQTGRVVHVNANVLPAEGDQSGISTMVEVALFDDYWHCTDHSGANHCAHRLAVQMATGWGHLGGMCRS